jgi:hypothetical protein
MSRVTIGETMTQLRVGAAAAAPPSPIGNCVGRVNQHLAEILEKTRTSTETLA